MKIWLIAVAFAAIILSSFFCVVQISKDECMKQSGYTCYVLFEKASEKNSECANWCADLQFSDEAESVACLKRVIERGYCRK